MSTFRLHILVLLIFVMFLGSCTPQRQIAREQRKLERRLDQRYEESEKILEQARKRHYDKQTSETQSRMNETRRKSAEWNRQGVPFYVRWYWAVISLFR